MALLDARLSVDYPSKPGALRDVSISIERAGILGLVGESGSGKSTLSLALLRLLDSKKARISGRAIFDGEDLLAMPASRMRMVRGRRISLVLQSPMSALNPALKIAAHFEEAWKAHRPESGADWKPRALEALALARLPGEEHLGRYAHQVSVGQAQRILIALAILHRPQLLIADEPTSALDPISQREILELLRGLNRDLGLSILFISHDLLSVACLCHRVGILKAGELVETCSVDRLLEGAEHPYTRALVESIPVESMRHRAVTAREPSSTTGC